MFDIKYRMSIFYNMVHKPKRRACVHIFKDLLDHMVKMATMPIYCIAKPFKYFSPEAVDRFQRDLA